VHLWPLAGRPTELWPEKARLALEAGFSAEEVGRAAYAGGQEWSGLESAMWGGWEQQFATLCSHEHAGIRDAAKVGRDYTRRRRDRALSVLWRVASVYIRPQARPIRILNSPFFAFQAAREHANTRSSCSCSLQCE
jgi:hypothetical protein